VFPHNSGIKDIKMTELNLLQKLKELPNEYRPVPFWFLNHYLREDELRRQIQEIAKKGFGGIMLHGRNGLRSGYLNDEWRQAVAWCIDEAVKLNLDVWLYDELNYPSGPMGGRIFDHHPNSRMQALEVVSDTEFGRGEAISITLPENFKFVLAAFEDGQIDDLTEKINNNCLSWTNPTEQQGHLLVFVPKVELYPSDDYPDYLDREAMETFVDLSYDWYAREFGEFFGDVIKGEFTDNSCLSFGLTRCSIPWTKNLDKTFLAKTGKKLTNILPGLFKPLPGYRENRLLFWKFIGDEYLETFIKPIDESCRKNKILSTGHYCIEDGSSEHIRQLGDRFDQKRNQGLPAVDMLGTDKPEDMEDLLRSRHSNLSLSIPGTSSAAYFSTESRVMCECFGLACGWQLDLGEMKRITGLLAVLGIDLFVPHGLYYSVAGHRKWECGPDHFHNPMWEFYREWTDWTSKLSYLTSYAERTSETALLYPANTQQAYIELAAAKKDGLNFESSDRGYICDLVDFTYRAAGNMLLENNIPYEIIDEKLIQAGVIEGNTLSIKAGNGKNVNFKAMVLPCAKVLEEATVNKLKSWQHVGGIIIALNAGVEDIYNSDSGELTAGNIADSIINLRIDFDSEAGLIAEAHKVTSLIHENTSPLLNISNSQGKIISRQWKKFGYEFCMLHNISRQNINDVKVAYNGNGTPVFLDLESLIFKKAFNDNKNEFTWSFSPSETLVLVNGEIPEDIFQLKYVADNTVPDQKIELANSWQMKRLSLNTLPLKSCQMQTIQRTQQYNYSFNIKNIPKTIRVAIDREMLNMELKFDHFFDNWLKCFVNGQQIKSLEPGTTLDRWIFEADISDVVRAGDNELRIEVSAMLLDHNRQCNMPLILGDFAIDSQDRIVANIDQVAAGDWRDAGLPYYAGMVSYSQQVKISSVSENGRLVLALGEIANAAEVFINGKSVGRKVLPPWNFDISEFKNEIETEVEIRIINTQANLWNEQGNPSGLLSAVEILCFNN
jgi:hypothetical protein